jgi:hypothetical protein
MIDEIGGRVDRVKLDLWPRDRGREKTREKCPCGRLIILWIKLTAAKKSRIDLALKGDPVELISRPNNLKLEIVP